MWKQLNDIEYKAEYIYNPKLGLGRSIIALGTLLTLLFNNSEILFKPGLGMEIIPICENATKLSIYCILNDNLDLARYISIIILSFVMIGFFPRITCFFHWWVCFSLNCCTTNLDGGDQVASVITLLLIPVCIFDQRKSHWERIDSNNDKIKMNYSVYKLFFSTISFKVIQIQVSIIYFHACVSKFFVPEWSNGTALYYWINDQLIGPNSLISGFAKFVLGSNFSIAILTWSVLFLEFFLFSSLFLNRNLKSMIFFLGVIFHISIAILFGIISFSTIMTGALVIYLLTYDKGPSNHTSKNYLI